MLAARGANVVGHGWWWREIWQWERLVLEETELSWLVIRLPSDSVSTMRSTDVVEVSASVDLRIKTSLGP